jgi:hypothetical protein
MSDAKRDGMEYVLNWFGASLLVSAFMLLCLLIFIVKFSLKTESTFTIAIFISLITIGLFAWGMFSFSVEKHLQDVWENLAYICGLTLYPLQIYFFLLFVEKGRFFTSTFFGKFILYIPCAFQSVCHYTLPYEYAFTVDVTFFLFWVTFFSYIWYLLYRKFQLTKSEIGRKQIEYSLLAFLIATSYYLMLLYSTAFSIQAMNMGWLIGIIIVMAVFMVGYGIVRYQLIVGTEFLIRGGLIFWITALCTISLFIIVQWLFLITFPGAGFAGLIMFDIFLIIAITLSLDWINNQAIKIIEQIFPGLKWRECKLQEVFVIHDSGTVIGHYEKKENLHSMKRDEDIVGGMLTAVQDFILDAFQASQDSTLKTLNMGRMKMLIEHHHHIYSAVIFTGFEAKELREGTKKLLDEINRQYGNTLEKWDGDVTELSGIKPMIEKLFAA